MNVMRADFHEIMDINSAPAEAKRMRSRSNLKPKAKDKHKFKQLQTGKS